MVRFKMQSDSQSCFREREDRAHPFLYKNPPAELRPLAVRAVTEEHTLMQAVTEVHTLMQAVTEVHTLMLAVMEVHTLMQAVT